MAAAAMAAAATAVAEAVATAAAVAAAAAAVAAAAVPEKGLGGPFATAAAVTEMSATGTVQHSSDSPSVRLVIIAATVAAAAQLMPAGRMAGSDP